MKLTTPKRLREFTGSIRMLSAQHIKFQITSTKLQISKESGPRGLGFDLTPKGCGFLLMVNGILE
jgi:hypothetical protein